jgi:hypothetical protein
VLLAERWIIAALRHRKFFSIDELNQAIRELRDRINQRPFRKREGSRASQFATVDNLNRSFRYAASQKAADSESQARIGRKLEPIRRCSKC